MFNIDPREIIRSSLPDLVIKSCVHIADGAHSTAYEINNDLIARFPITTQAQAAYKIEHEMLNIVRQYVSLPIPETEVYGAGKSLFTVHEKIKGDPFHQCSLTDLKNISNQLAKFLAELHEIPTKDLNLPLYRRHEFEKGDLKKLKEERTLLFGINALEEAIQRPLLKNEKSVLLHNDLNETNFLIGGDMVTGIIDFGYMHVGVRSSDFAPIIKNAPRLASLTAKEYERITHIKIDLQEVFDTALITAYRGILRLLPLENLSRYDQKRYADYFNRINILINVARHEISLD